ncbi:MAG: sodium:alanine symporter family protein, partial [Clostridia bacterium]|nr:sodium:alanine symporter family protein [Clostridia bacterium]
MEQILALMESALNFVYSNILSIAMMVLLIAGGLFLSIKLGFLQFRRFGYTMKNTIGTLFDKNLHKKEAGSVSPFQAVTTALAGTIGTGSIAGLATALVLGGPGAVFWMWISALFGMVTKYSEIVLSLKYRETNEEGAYMGGPMYYIKNGLGKKWGWLAAMFALFAMIACIGTGNATQSNSISGVINSTFNVAPWITGIVLTVIVGAVILGGVKRIASVNEKLVPVMAVLFILTSIVALIFNAEKIPAAFGLIFSEAFNFKAAFGGVAGYGILAA